MEAKKNSSPTLALALLIAAAAFALAPQTALAELEGTYEVAVKKQQQKKNSRWSLAEWMAMKERNRLMDLWLAQNSHSSLYEFFLETQGINYGQYESSTPSNITNRNAYGGTLAAYAGVAGLRGGYEGDTESRTTWHGSFNIRLLGRALQDTHLNLEYGLRGTTIAPPSTQPTAQPENFQNQFGAVSLNLYLTKAFGVEGAYRKILPAENDRKRTLQGESSQAGIFIDFGLLRVFGSWRKEFHQFDGGGLPNIGEFREGFGGGLRFYF